MTEIYTQPLMTPLHERYFSYDHRSLSDSYSSSELKKSHPFSSQLQLYERSTREPRSLMSNPKKADFEAPPSKAGDLYPKSPETSQNPPREQLPSLSSLFGSSSSSSHQSIPAQSPYSNRHSPVFPAASPLDARHPATPVHPDRPFENSYFQRPSVTRQYSYNSKPEPVERLGLPAPPRPAQAGASPESPGYESHYGQPEAARPQYHSGWSPRSQASAQEYFAARDTSSSFRPHSEHRPHPPQIHRLEPESRPTYRDPTHSTPITPKYPPTPASTIAGDSIAVKDGLGPKIWTGTQFLPRFVRQAEVPGEGMCYFYDDGTHCKTVIDGEIVNAHWGVTKAGKPRKRLAIACITCREKKIKCDPDYPRCVQCEKFGRVCKFKNAPRGGQGSPDTPPADPEDLTPRPTSSSTDTELFKVEQREESQPISPRQTLRRATPDSETHPSKRQRIGYTNFTPVASEASPRPSVQEPISPSNPWPETLVTCPIDHNVLREWQVNPYTTQPALVTELVSLFFRYVPETAYCMFSEGPFKAWILSAGEKSLDDLMLIYTVLALGTVYSSKPEQKAVGSQFAAISRYACLNRHFSLQLVQSRLILALYYFATNNPNDSWDACGGAIRAASGLRLNVEFEKSEDVYLKTFPYGLNRHGYAECRRRTFWCCYLMDRFNGFCSGLFSVIHPEDVFLRLPCDANSFEAQVEVHNPYFDPTTPSIQNTNWTIGSMAYLINVSTIWGDIMANIYRTTQRPVPATSNSAFTAFYENASKRLHAWKDSLPNCFQFSPESLNRAAEGGKLGTYMTMHAVYYTSSMKLNRYMRHSILSASQIAHHVSVAQQHAETLLVIMDTLAARRTLMPSPISPTEQSASATKFSSPFIGYAIISVIDILTAKVSLATVRARLSSFSGAQTILAEIGLFWASARTQQALVQQRIRDLAELTAAGKDEAGATGFRFWNAPSGVGRNAGSGDGMFEMREPLEKTFPRDYDCVYA